MQEQNNSEAKYKGFPRALKPADEFYRAVHPHLVKSGGVVSPAAFRNPNTPPSNRMSVDWAEKSTPQQTFDRWMKRWEEFGGTHGVAVITAQPCWDNGQMIEFTPSKDQPTIEDNPAHSDVIGAKSNRITKNLAKVAKLLIPQNPT